MNPCHKCGKQPLKVLGRVDLACGDSNCQNRKIYANEEVWNKYNPVCKWAIRHKAVWPNNCGDNADVISEDIGRKFNWCPYCMGRIIFKESV